MVVVWQPPCTGGNKARGVSAESLIVKTAGSIRERLTGRHVEDPLARGKAQGYPRRYPTGSLALAMDSYEGLQRGLGRSLHASRYISKNTRVIDGSLHISTLLFSFHIYIDYFTTFAVEIATH